MTWIIIRSSGFIAYALLAGASIWGLLVATKLLGRSVSAKSLTYVHESLSLGAILATIVHIGALLADNYIEFTVRDVTIPGSATWRPAAMALGIVGMYGLVGVTASFYVRKHIGQKTWRRLHYLSFGVFVATALHGITSGTDTLSPIGIAVYSSTVTAVLGLVGFRIFTFADRPRRPAASLRAEREINGNLRSSERGSTRRDASTNRLSSAPNYIEAESG